MKKYPSTIRHQFIGKALLMLLFMIPLCFIPALGQAIQTGIITGKVVDVDGEPLTGVKIVLISDSINQARISTFTDTDGDFRIPGLSPGVYKVFAELEGFRQERSEFINVRVSSENQLSITLLIGESITPKEGIPGGPMIFLLPDDKGLSISSNMLSRSPGFPQLMPSINSTPGVVEVGSGLSSKGSSIRSNLYYYQDVNITDPYEGTNIINLKFPETSVVSISSLGKSVKNQATGTSINITSETSSDKLSFSTTFNYLRDLFKSDFQSGETSLTSEMQDVSLQIGGPIGDDRFWVQGSYLRSSFDHTNQIEALTPAHDSEYLLTARGSFFSSTNNKISGIYLGNGFLSKNHFSPDLTTWTIHDDEPESVTNDLDRNVDFLSFKDELLLSEIMRLDITYSWMSYNKKILPSSGINTLPSKVDPVTRELLQGSYLGEWQKARGERLLFTGNLDFYLDEMAGTHEITLGLEVEKDEISLDRGFDGSYKEFHSQGVKLYRKFYSRPNSPPSDVKSELTLTRFSIYGQDSWFPRSNISVNFGVVYNGPQIENRSSRVIDWDDISPRLALNWDVLDDGKTILRGGVSRYHEKALGTAAPQDLYGMSTVFWHKSVVDLGYLTGEKGRNRWRTPFDTHTYYGSGDEANQADLETISPYTDEFFLALEHEPADDIAIGANFVFRRTRDLLEDYEVLRSGSTLIPNPDSIYQPETAFDNFGNPYTYFKRLPKANDNYSMELYWGNDERLYRDYYAFEIYGKTRPIHGLELRANYTLSSSKGNLDVTAEDTSSYSWSQNSPSRFINSDGYLSNDHRHKLNLAAIYFAPYDFILGFKASYLSGSPYNRYLYNYDLYDLNHSIRANPRGEEYRNDALFIADFRLEKEVIISESNFLLSIDVLNMLDSQAVTARDLRDLDSFQTPISLTGARVIQLGLSYRF